MVGPAGSVTVELTMDGPHIDPDDDVTVVGDHELVAELRRQTAAAVAPRGRPLPPPCLPVVTAPAAPSLGSLPAAPRPVTTAVPSSWYEDEWEDDDEDERSPLVWVVLAFGVAAAVVVALLLVR